jgi:hypothetical protein
LDGTFIISYTYPSSSRYSPNYYACYGMDRMLYRVPSGIHLHDVEGIRLTVIKHPMNVPASNRSPPRMHHTHTEIHYSWCRVCQVFIYSSAGALNEVYRELNYAR